MRRGPAPVAPGERRQGAGLLHGNGREGAGSLGFFQVARKNGGAPPEVEFGGRGGIWGGLEVELGGMLQQWGVMTEVCGGG